MKTPNEDAIGGLLELKLALIDPDPKNRKPQGEEADAGLESLAASIKTEGLLQPVVVRLHPNKPGRYMLVAGERRWRAHGINKADTIFARLVKPGTAEVDAVRKRAVENLQRVDLSPLDEARQFRELVEDHKMSQPDVAKLAGKQTPSYVSNSLRLLQNPKEIQDMLQSGVLSRAHGVALARFAKWPKIATFIAQRAVKEGDTAKELEGNGLPYGWELEKAKLVVRTDRTGDGYYRSYTIPASLKGDSSFIDDYCLEPAKWLPERDRQDKAFEEKNKKADKAEAGRQSTMTPSQKAERQKKIAENKQAKAESAMAHVVVMQRVKEMKDFDAAGVVVLACTAVGAHWKYGTTERVKSIAGQLGITLPKGFDLSDVASVQKMKPVDVMRLAVGCLVDLDSVEAAKYANPICDRVEHVLGPKMTAMLRAKAKSAIAAAAAKKGGAK